MSVVIESSQTGSSSNSASVTVTKPTGLAVDDLIVAVIYAHDTSGSPGLNTPSGWTLVGSNARAMTGSDIMEYAIFYKKAASGDVAASNFTFSAGTTMDFIDAVLLRVSGIRTDVASLGAFSRQSKTDTDNPSFTVSLSPAQDNVLYIATFTSFDIPFTATNVTLNGTNPTWTRYLNASHTVDSSAAVQVFASIDATPESSITTVTPTETGSNSGTDSECSLSFFMGQVDVNATLSLVTTSNTVFSPLGSAGAHATIATTETTNEAFGITAIGSTGTKWTKINKS